MGFFELDAAGLEESRARRRGLDAKRSPLEEMASLMPITSALLMNLGNVRVLMAYLDGGQLCRRGPLQGRCARMRAGIGLSRKIWLCFPAGTG